MNEFYVFDTKSNDEELTKRFHRFFKINGLDPLFTREHQSSHITVSDLEMRSLVNTGKTAQPLLEIRDLLTMYTDKKRYASAVLRLIDETRSFTKFINNLIRLYINNDLTCISMSSTTNLTINSSTYYFSLFLTIHIPIPLIPAISFDSLVNSDFGLSLSISMLSDSSSIISVQPLFTIAIDYHL